MLQGVPTSFGQEFSKKYLESRKAGVCLHSTLELEVEISLQFDEFSEIGIGCDIFTKNFPFKTCNSCFSFSLTSDEVLD